MVISGMSIDQLLKVIRAAESDPPPGFADMPLEPERGGTFDLPADVVVRSAVATREFRAADTAVLTYAYGGARFGEHGHARHP
jgi:hypothetical protein